MNTMKTMSMLPSFKLSGMKPARAPEMTAGMQPITTMVTPMSRDLSFGDTSSKANSWMTGLTKISPMPVTQYGMKVHQAVISDIGAPDGAHWETSSHNPPAAL